jgi:hypothetical protein
MAQKLQGQNPCQYAANNLTQLPPKKLHRQNFDACGILDTVSNY